MNENTTEGPLTATVGERLGEKAQAVQEAVGAARREGRFPWTALLAAAGVWLLVRGLSRGLGRTARTAGRKLRRRRRR
jgi:hypothetical protein